MVSMAAAMIAKPVMRIGRRPHLSTSAMAMKVERTFVMLGVFNFAFIFFTMMYVPETKGISLEGIEKNLMEGKKLRNLGNAS